MARRTGLWSIALAILMVAPAFAHHSFAVYDHTRTLTLRGSVTRFQWTNPHGFIEMDVQQSDGSVKHYSVELTSINMMQRVGWRSNMIKPGDKVQVVIAPLLSGEPVGLGLEVVLADGKTMALPVPAIGGFKRYGNAGVRGMRALRPLLAFTGALLVVTSPATIAQTPAVPDITGSWLRQGFTVGVRPPGQESPAPPPAAPPPPLKQPYLKEWQDRIQKIREADAKGQPIATNAVACLPEGMPGMMTATFPMEILQSRGQITIIEEAYTQVRRILMDRPQPALDDIEPGFYGHSVGRWEGDTLVVRHDRNQRGRPLSECAALERDANRRADAIRGARRAVERNHDHRSHGVRKAVDVHLRVSTDEGLHAPRIHLRR